MYLNVNNLRVSYGDLKAVDDISFQLDAGAIGCLLGPSGCGKTTVLRAIAGFGPVAGGRIEIDGRAVSGSGVTVPTEKRKVGMVFQDFALFPHLSVAHNIAFGLRRLPTAQQNQRVRQLLDLIGLDGMAGKFPHELSAGQQQRIALARALAPRPSILLLDEPFSSIDVELREQLAREVKRILNEEKVTALLVTHDQMEAFAIAHVIGVMHQGRLHQWDTGYNLYHKPADLFVADFIGQGALINGKVRPDLRIETDLGIIGDGRLNNGLRGGEEAVVLIRPDDIIHDDQSKETARVIEKAFRGAEFLYTLELKTGTRLYCFAPSHHNHTIGEPIGIRLELDHLVAFKKSCPI
ncbi:MAG TPA: ABC transporter ATP-binding protein [Gammaproteobacteria bacterium]